MVGMALLGLARSAPSPEGMNDKLTMVTMASKLNVFNKCYRMLISAISSSVVRLEPSSLLILIIHLVLICMMPSLITITSHGTES